MLLLQQLSVPDQIISTKQQKETQKQWQPLQSKRWRLSYLVTPTPGCELQRRNSALHSASLLSLALAEAHAEAVVPSQQSRLHPGHSLLSHQWRKNTKGHRGPTPSRHWGPSGWRTSPVQTESIQSWGGCGYWLSAAVCWGWLVCWCLGPSAGPSLCCWGLAMSRGSTEALQTGGRGGEGCVSRGEMY